MLSIQEKMYRVLWNQRFLVIPKDIETPNGLRYVIIKDPSVAERNYHSFLKEWYFSINVEEGVPTEEQIIAISKASGDWPEEDQDYEQKLSELESMLSKQKNKLFKQKYIKQIDLLKEKRLSILRKQDYLKMQTADYASYEAASLDLIRDLVLNPNGQRLWSDEKVFMDHKKNYIGFIIFLAHKVITEGSLPVKDIRELARYSEWRLIWSLGKEDIASVFNKPISELNINQKMLCYWSKIYDSIYEDPEKPSQAVIDDDEELDAWLTRREDNSKSNKNKPGQKDHNEYGQPVKEVYVEDCTCGVKSIKAKGLGERPLHINGCLYGTLRVLTQDEKDRAAHKVYNRNNDKIRQLINSEQNQIEQRGLIEEQHLRGKKTRTILGSEIKIHEK